MPLLAQKTEQFIFRTGFDFVSCNIDFYAAQCTLSSLLAKTLLHMTSQWLFNKTQAEERTMPTQKLDDDVPANDGANYHRH